MAFIAALCADGPCGRVDIDLFCHTSESMYSNITLQVSGVQRVRAWSEVEGLDLGRSTVGSHVLRQLAPKVQDVVLLLPAGMITAW